MSGGVALATHVHPSVLLARPRIVGLAKAASRKDWTLLGQTMSRAGWTEPDVDAFRLWIAEVLAERWVHFDPGQGFNFTRFPDRLVLADHHLRRPLPANFRVALATRALLGK